MKISFPIFYRNPTFFEFLVVAILMFTLFIAIGWFVIFTFEMHMPWLLLIFPALALFIAWKKRYFVVDFPDKGE